MSAITAGYRLSATVEPWQIPKGEAVGHWLVVTLWRALSREVSPLRLMSPEWWRNGSTITSTATTTPKFSVQALIDVLDASSRKPSSDV